MIGSSHFVGALVAVAGALAALVQVHGRLANPTAPRHAAPVQMSAEVSEAALDAPARASADEVRQLRSGCFHRRRLQTRVGSSGWVMDDADATAKMCDCLARDLEHGSSRLQWLLYVNGEQGDGLGQRAIEVRIERLGRSREERMVLVRQWQSRREAVLRDCRRMATL